MLLFKIGRSGEGRTPRSARQAEVGVGLSDLPPFVQRAVVVAGENGPFENDTRDDRL